MEQEELNLKTKPKQDELIKKRQFLVKNETKEEFF